MAATEGTSSTDNDSVSMLASAIKREDVPEVERLLKAGVWHISAHLHNSQTEL